MTTMAWLLKQKRFFRVLLLVLVLAPVQLCQARDTDIYAVNAKQNCYILLDNSGSMAYGVYESNIDYGKMYLYLAGLPGITDPTNLPDVNPTPFPRNKIYLVKGPLDVGVKNGVAFTGDPGSPSLAWQFGTTVDTHTFVDYLGNLTFEGGNRITLDAAKNILLDANTLPLTQGRKEHNYVSLYDGTVIDKGFGGLLNAPGYHFSGYEDTDSGIFNNPVEDGADDTWFFVTGNWLNMQAVYNLKDASGLVWDRMDVPLADITSDWLTLAKSIDYPAGIVTYAPNLNNKLTATIKQSGALKIQVHFSYYDMRNNDSVKLYDATNTLKATYGAVTDADGFWGPIIDGDTVAIKMSSDNKDTVGYGYIIDEIRYVDKLSGDDGVYRMQSRLAVAKEALLYVVDEFRGRMNWGFANFTQEGSNDGATVAPLLNPTDSDDSQRAAIAGKVALTKADGGTPLGEALQDTFEKGYYQHRSSLDNLLCRKNYVIAVTDGYPSTDDKWERIDGVTFSDFDGDGWTQDPAQYSDPPPDYYDDVAHWMYTHSWLDKSVVADPANSFVNVITHHIGFSLDQPLLEDAAGESGGDYLTAFNKQQLIAAFYSLALKMSGAISFTAPVVSVDAVNKIQSGDDLYMGLFLPKASSYWVGNLKKFKLGDGSAARPDLWMIYDKLNNPAIDSFGVFLDNTYGHWGNDTDNNDHDSYGAADVQEDGAGDVMLDDLNAYFQAGMAGTIAAYWTRPIYTYKGGAMTKFDRNTVTEADLAVADSATRDKLVNFVHGYTYDADAVTGAPLALRDWSLGAIVHSRPVVLDYYDTTQVNLPLVKRFVAVGANDGMLHVFVDQDTTKSIVEGQEVFSFIPQDILPFLKNIQATLGLYDTVDGPITLYRRGKNPKYLIFGERRGGGHYWCLDVSNSDPTQWTVAWNYTNAELVESWSDVKLASIQIGVDTNTGARTYRDVAIFTGGYDPLEDNFPEPFLDSNNNGIPGTVAADGSLAIDNQEWKQTNAAQDLNGSGGYNVYNPGSDTQGRGIFVVDIDDPATQVSDPSDATGARKILPFAVTATGSIGNVTRADMKFCFPASPSVVAGPETYRYINTDGNPVSASQSDVLYAVYAVDIYANVFKLDFSFVVENSGTASAPKWQVKSASWQDSLIFKANPGSTSASGALGGADNLIDQGRKVFYPPAISWGGAGSYFDYRNYQFELWRFDGLDRLASLFLGTGDREHPKYAMVNDRFYSIYDDSSASATLYTAPVLDAPAEALLSTCQRYGFYCPDLQYGTVSDTAVVSGVPYTEKDLLNLTCDELGSGTVIDSAVKTGLKTLLLDNAKYYDTLLAKDALEKGRTHEDDAKGWYIILAKQGDANYCAAYTYPTALLTTDINSRDNHLGEKILSQPILYNKILYFTSYQPAYSNACNPSGNGFSYALDYTTGAAALNLNTTNTAVDVSDRYRKYVGIHGIPSGFAIITRDGHAAAMASMGGAIIGPGELKGDAGYEIPSAGSGLELYYWREGGSLLP
jgi:type IV pilus assembly protein PilY1